MDQKRAIKLAKEYIEALRGEVEFSRVYLFGSFSKCDFNDESDVDIAIVMPDFENLLDMQLHLMRIRRNIDSRIEPHPIRDNDFNEINPFAYEIIKSGIRIF